MKIKRQKTTKVKHKKITKKFIAPQLPVVVVQKTLNIKSCGLYDGKWGIILSDGSILSGVEEILQTKPSYSDGFIVTAKIFIPFKDKPITASA